MAVAESGEWICGREAELDAVEGLIADARSVPAAIVVQGEAGIGKTTLVRAATARASAAGLRVFAARPSAGELELPFVGLADLLAGVAPDAFVALPGPQRAALQAAVTREGSAVTPDEHALARGLVELLEREAAANRVLVVIDDVQWLDRPTTAALTFALRRIGSVPLRVLAAARGPDVTLPLGLAEWKNVRGISPGPLSSLQLGTLIRRHQGTALSSARLKALRRTSGGNPLFALELARHASREGWDGRPPTLPAMMTERLQALEPSVRSAVTLAASALHPTCELLVRAGAAEAELAKAVSAGILVPDGDRLVFTHPLLATAADGLLIDSERRRAHARLAGASADPVERGHHIARSVQGTDATAAEVVDVAAEAAAALGDHSGAAALLLRAAELSAASDGDREARATIELRLAGDATAAGELSRRLVARLPPGVPRARARRSLSADMTYTEAVAETGRALDDAAGDLAMTARLQLDMADHALGTCRLGAAVTHATTALGLAEQAGDDAMAVQALSRLGFAQSMLGLGATDHARRALAGWDGVIGWDNSPRMLLACALIPAGAFDEAIALFEQEIAAAAAAGAEPIEAIARAHLAEAQIRAGQWMQALANAQLAHEHARQCADEQIVAASAYALATVQALLGDHATARAVAIVALDTAQVLDDFWFTISHRSVLGLIALAERDPQTVVTVLEPAWRLMVDRGLGDLSLFPVAPVLGEALATLGRLDETMAIAAALRACPVGAGAWCRAMSARCAGLVAAARSEPEAARRAFGTALAAHAEFPEPFEHARAMQLLGHVERRSRNWGAARVAFTDARERFTALGAACWAEHAASALDRLPGRRPIDRHALTAREQEIAELVASGLANKQIALRLHLSVRTVEANLSKAYIKLGVRSRTELVRRLSRPDPR